MLAIRVSVLVGCAVVWGLTSAGTSVHAVEMPLPAALRKAVLTETEGTLARNEKCLPAAAVHDLAQISADHAVGVGRYVAEVLRARSWGGVPADCRCLQTIATATVAHRPDVAAPMQASLGNAFPECALPLSAAIEQTLLGLPAEGGIARGRARPGGVAARTCAGAQSCLAIEPPRADVTPRTQLR